MSRGGGEEGSKDKGRMVGVGWRSGEGEKSSGDPANLSFMAG